MYVCIYVCMCVCASMDSACPPDTRLVCAQGIDQFCRAIGLPLRCHTVYGKWSTATDVVRYSTHDQLDWVSFGQFTVIRVARTDGSVSIALRHT
jgi:hypothetical protein